MQNIYKNNLYIFDIDVEVIISEILYLIFRNYLTD